MIQRSGDGRSTEVKASQVWVFALDGATALIAVAIEMGLNPTLILLIGLGVFGFLFAVNVAGRFVGTLLSGHRISDWWSDGLSPGCCG